jgi:hypothetical protein
MNRAELETLDREDLIARAEAAGVARARILTRPELVDELLIRSAADQATKQRARGFFGLARDLLARVVERGLHLPDAADRIRTLGALPAAKRSAPAALPTVTLAEIYAAQGHRQRAIETLESVLAREPDHAAARALLTQLNDATFPVPPPRLPPEEEEVVAPAVPASASDQREESKGGPSEPTHMLDDAPLPTRYDVDECVAIPVDPETLYVYWEVRDRTIEYMRATRPGGTIALRVVIVTPTWDGPRSSVRDHDVHATLGDYFVRGLPAGCVVRAAIGWKIGDSFLSIAHSSALETPPGMPSPLLADVLVKWTPHGATLVGDEDDGAEQLEKALGRARSDAARAAGRAGRGGAGQRPLGSSERAAWPGPGGVSGSGRGVNGPSS